MANTPCPSLYIFSGLPATGKTRLAKLLARKLSAAYLRVDTVEQGLRDLCDVSVEGEGYRLSYRIAAENVLIGVSVVADSCNPIELTRDEWQEVEEQAGAGCVNVETQCSDVTEHRVRAERRQSDIEGLVLPSWQAIENREFHPWSAERIVVETSGRSIDESFNELLAALERRSCK
ncbi:MAG: ATP-binding protein [Pseudomonadota bacterium]